MNTKNIAIAAALLIALLSTAVFAAADDQYTQGLGGAETLWTGNGTTQTGWITLAISAVMTSFFALGLIYMFAHALSFDSVKKWVSGELIQAVASGLIIVMLIALLTLVLPYVETITGQGICLGKDITDPIEYSQCKIQEKINVLDSMFTVIYNANKDVEAAAATCYSMVNIQFYCGDWTLRPTVETAHLLSAKITPLLINLHGQFVLLDYIRANMLSIFLPLGVLLRTFPPTRGLGGLFIAVAIGFYIVFPMLLMIGDFTNVNPYTNLNQPTLRKCYTSFAGCSVILSDVMGGGAGNAEAVYAEAASKLASLTVTILLYPFIAFAATLVFINNAASILGGDAAMMTRMAQKVIV